MLKWDEGGECVWNPHEVLLLWATDQPFLWAAVHHQEEWEKSLTQCRVRGALKGPRLITELQRTAAPAPPS